MTCVAFSIKFAKTNQKFAENSEICENYSLLFKIIHWCPYSKARSGKPGLAGALQRDGVAEEAHELPGGAGPPGPREARPVRG